MTELEELQKQLNDIREAMQKLTPGSHTHQKLDEELATLKAQLTGSGAVAQGNGATAIGEDGIGVGGNLDGTLIKGEQNQIFRNSTVILAGDGARILVGEQSIEHNSKPDTQVTSSYTATSTGILTFLFTDIVGSTRLLEQHPEAMKVALARHDAILRGAIENHKGKVFKIVGDVFYAAFPNANNALKAALEAQRTLHAEAWGETAIKVRMALHTGAVEIRDNDYFGATLNRVALLMSSGHGGQTLVSSITRELIQRQLPLGVALQDMGEFILRDLVRPERIYQLNAEGLPSDFPPLKTLDAFHTNLPVQLTSFIGREKEIAAVKKLIVKNRQVSLTGSGGAGKSRLSIQVAVDLLEAFPDGVWFVELAPISDPVLVSRAIMSALAIREEDSREPLAILEDYLRSRTALLILDNCEHVLVAAAQLAESLLMTCSGLRILTSSREALGIAGEIAYLVPSLSTPDPRILLGVESLGQFEATRLFIERAQAALPTFTVTDENAHAIAQVCARLDGIPLAIELAAARIKVLKVEEIAERLDDCFRLLTGGSRTALPHHQTLRAMIDWSHESLPEPERVLLRRLSVFSGGWTLDAAEMVCQGSGITDYDVLSPLTRLVEKSLVVANVDEIVETRYRLLETVRQYAREKLMEAGEGMSLRDRHMEYFLGLAERAEPEFVKPKGMRWLQHLELEIDNIRTALKWAVKRNVLFGLQMANSLRYFWFVNNHVDEANDWFALLLQHPQAQTPTLIRAKALSIHAYWKKSRPILEEGVALFRTLGDKNGIAFSVVRLASLVEDKDQAQGLVEEGLMLYEELNDKLGTSEALRRLAIISTNSGHYEQARNCLENELAIHHEIGNRLGIVWASAELGHLALKQNNLVLAHAIFEKNYQAAKEIGLKVGMVYAIEGEARLAVIHEQPKRALQLFAWANHIRKNLKSTSLPIEQADTEREITKLRAELDESTFSTTCAAGWAMSMDDAIALAWKQ